MSLGAGAVGTPQILQLSGIGPGALLQRHGIPVRHDPPTARVLHASVKIGEPIRPDHYRAVAAAIVALAGKGGSGVHIHENDAIRALAD